MDNSPDSRRTDLNNGEAKCNKLNSSSARGVGRRGKSKARNAIANRDDRIWDWDKTAIAVIGTIIAYAVVIIILVNGGGHYAV